MDESKPYQAVSCDMHSELELAIMHGKSLKIVYKKIKSKFKNIAYNRSETKVI